jgi:hypothetical protein
MHKKVRMTSASESAEEAVGVDDLPASSFKERMGQQLHVKINHSPSASSTQQTDVSSKQPLPPPLAASTEPEAPRRARNLLNNMPHPPSGYPEPLPGMRGTHLPNQKLFSYEAMSVIDPRRLWNVPFQEIDVMLRARASGTGRTYGIAEPLTKPFARFHIHILLISSSLGGRLSRGQHIIFRLLLLIYWSIWGVLSIHRFPNKWVVYMSHWSIVTLEIQLILMLIFALAWSEPSENNAIALWHKSTCACSHCQELYFSRAHWRGRALYNLAKLCWKARNLNCGSVFVVLINWCCIMATNNGNAYLPDDPRGGHPIAAHAHIGGVVLMLLETAISDLPLLLTDVWYPAAYCLVYGLFTVPLPADIASGYNSTWECCTYPLYDWSKDAWQRSCLLLLSMTVLAIPVIQLVLVKWHQAWRGRYPHIRMPKRSRISAAVRLSKACEMNPAGRRRSAWEMDFDRMKSNG